MIDDLPPVNGYQGIIARPSFVAYRVVQPAGHLLLISADAN